MTWTDHRTVALTAAAVVLLTAVLAAAEEQATLTLSPLAKAPVIDGKIGEGEWDGAGGTANFMDVWQGYMDLRTGYTRVGFTNDRLYFLCVSEVPPTGALARVAAHDSDAVVHDDSVELWLDPNRQTRDAGKGDLAYYQAIFGAAGGIFDVRFDPRGTPDRGWNADWEHATQIDTSTGMMTMEFSVPFADLGWPPSQAPIGQTIGVLVSRNFKLPWDQAVWFPSHGQSFDKPLSYAAVRLTADEPVVRIDAVGDDFAVGKVALRVSIFNPGAARDVKVNLQVTSSDMPGFSDEKTLQLPAGETVEYTLANESLHADAEHALSLTITEPGAAQPNFHYATRWTNQTRVGGRRYPTKWEVQAEPKPADALKVAFYPSLNLARVQLEPVKLFKTPEEAKSVGSAELAITGPDGQPIATDTIVLDGAVVERTYHFEALPEGDYTATATFAGVDTPIAHTWTRKPFPWEGNTLGITDKIHPPFEPVRVEGDSHVKVVLRDYEVDGLGLWRSVRSADKDLLAAPIALKLDGEAVAGQGTFTATDPQTAVYEGSAERPAVKLTTRCTTELDGVMKVELTLEPGAEAKPIESLVLDIPIVEQRAQLFHVSTTGLRSNPAGALPEGQGEIWNSTSFPDGNWIGNFKPYVWIGDGMRGIAFFADNDKGWELKVVDPKRQTYAPSQTIIREDGVVRLRVNIIQQAVTITEPRTIVFGLMATPGKPMPDNFRRTVLNNHVDGCQRVQFMGSQYWGSDQHCSAKYPRHGDLSVLDAVRDVRLGKSVNNSAFIEAWAARHFGPDMPVSKPKEQMMKLVDVTLNSARNTPASIPYTVYFEEFHSTSSLHAEVPVFASEWSGRFGYGSVGALVQSHRDFACYYGAEFIRRGIGLYFDNAFLKRGLDPLTSSAYQLPDGRIQPSSGVWAHRDYLRRIWNMHRELSPEGMPTYMIIHITNAEIAPYTVWNDGNLDLEWMYGPEPKQAIYSPELLRTESTGLVSGNSPFVLARVSNTESPEQEAFVYRSRIGTMLVHEIIQEQMRPSEIEFYKLLLAFGYGLEECEVYQYWLDEYPLQVSDERVKTLLLKRGNELMILACSWNPEPGTVSIDFGRVGLSAPRLSVVDCEANEAPLQLLDSNTVSMALEGYGVRLIKVVPEP